MSRLMTKPTKWHVRSTKIRISLGRILAVRVKKAWVICYHWAHIKDPDRTGRMPKLIRVFTGRTNPFLLVLSLDGTNMFGWYEEWPYIICSQRKPRSNRIFARSSGLSVSAQGVIGIFIHVINWRVSMVLIGVHEIYSLFDLSLLWTHMSLGLFSHAETHKCIVCNSL